MVEKKNQRLRACHFSSITSAHVLLVCFSRLEILVAVSCRLNVIVLTGDSVLPVVFNFELGQIIMPFT